MQCEVQLGKFKFLLEDKGEKELFTKMARVQEVFGQGKCGHCESENVRYSVREVEGNDFYELVCQEPGCRAKLAFGQHKQGGTLFPRRKDAEGNYLGHNGWDKWDASRAAEKADKPTNKKKS